jgi:hypothetical protein
VQRDVVPIDTQARPSLRIGTKRDPTSAISRSTAARTSGLL